MEDRTASGEGSIFKNDSWSNWYPDPQRAFREHDSSLPPYASMSREEILEAMLDARGGQEWEFLREFLLDKCAEDERHYERFVAILTGDGDPERELFASWNEVAGMATRMIPPSPDPANIGGYDSGRGTSIPRAAPSSGKRA